ncbi:hypothetical protein Rruber_04498 [Rhodococcus ruber]|nr:putative membrane protein [Rhodococcus ruber]
MIVGIVSICIGFVLFVLAASGTRGGWNRKLTITLFVLSVLFLTLVPVTGAVFFAT